MKLSRNRCEMLLYGTEILCTNLGPRIWQNVFKNMACYMAESYVFPGTLGVTSEDKSSFKRRFKLVKCWNKLYEELGFMIPCGQVTIYLEDFLTNKELICFARSLFISFIPYPLVLNTVLVTQPALKSIKLELVAKSRFWLNCRFFFIQN